MATGTLDFAINVNNTKAFESVLEKSIMRGVVGGMDVAFSTSNLNKLDAAQNYEDWWIKATEDVGKKVGEDFVDDIADEIEEKGPGKLKRAFDKVWGMVPQSAKNLLGFGTVLAIFDAVRDKIVELDILFVNIGKTIGRFAGNNVAKMRKQFVGAAIDMKKSMPLAELSDITNLMGEFALEGVRDTKTLKKLVPSMEAFAYFNGEAAEAMIPLLSTLVKTGRQLPNLDKALGFVNAGFGKFAGQGLAAIAKLSRFSKSGDFEKLSKTASAFATGLQDAGMSGGEVTDFMGDLLNPDFRKIPRIFQPFTEQIRAGNFDGVIGKMREFQSVAKGTSDRYIHSRAESLGISAEMLMSLKHQEQDIGVVMAEAAKKQKKQSTSIAAQYENATSSIMQRFQKMKERIGLVFTDIALKAIRFVEKSEPVIREMVKNISDSLQAVDWDSLWEKGKDFFGFVRDIDFNAIGEGFKGILLAATQFGDTVKFIADNWEIIVAGMLTMKATGGFGALAGMAVAAGGKGAAGMSGMLGKLGGVMGKMGLLAQAFTAAFAFGTWIEKKFIGGGIGDWMFENLPEFMGGETDSAAALRRKKEFSSMSDSDFLNNFGKDYGAEARAQRILNDAKDGSLGAENKMLLMRLLKVSEEQLKAALGQEKYARIQTVQGELK